MPWRYGIIHFRSQKNPAHRFYGVGEVYYESDPLKPFACSMEPDSAYYEAGDSDGVLPEDLAAKVEILESLRRMILDCERYPVFDSDGPFAPAPWKDRLPPSSLTDKEALEMSDGELSEKIHGKDL